MLKLDYSILIQIANFVFLIWALNLILFRPIRKQLADREKGFSGLDESIAAFDKEAQEKDQAFSQGIKDARAKGIKEKEHMMAQAAEAERQTLDEINQNAQVKLTAVREQITKEAGDVKEALEKEVATFASAIVQKVLGRAV